MKVVLSAEALSDLQQIGDYIAQDNPARARSFVAELLGKARALADMPHAFPVVPRYAHLGVRRRAHGSYLITFRVADERVTVIHILHGGRDYEGCCFQTSEGRFYFRYLVNWQRIAERLNNRPRKVLNFETPNEVFARLVVEAQTTAQQCCASG